MQCKKTERLWQKVVEQQEQRTAQTLPQAEPSIWRQYQPKVGGGNTAASVTQTAKYDADYISNKTKEIKGFKLPKANDFEYINIKGTKYRVRHEKTYDGRHIVDLIRTSDNYSMGRDVFTSGGSYGMATTRTRSQVVSSLRNELLNLLKHG